MLKIGTQSNIIDKKVLIYYETINITKYFHSICVEKELFFLSILKLNAWKLILILMVLII